MRCISPGYLLTVTLCGTVLGCGGASSPSGQLNDFDELDAGAGGSRETESVSAGGSTDVGTAGNEGGASAGSVTLTAGSPAVGGGFPAGGAAPTGGAEPTGGSSVGGAAPTGGSSVGGAGGNTPMGGASSVGGSSGGGSAPTGGSSVGGAGGNTPMGGASSMGGSSGGGTAPTGGFSAGGAGGATPAGGAPAAGGGDSAGGVGGGIVVYPGGATPMGGAGGLGGELDATVPLPAGCTATSRPGDENWCLLEAECNGSPSGVYCFNSGDSWQCSCSQQPVGFSLRGGEPSTSCVKALEYCEQPEEPAFVDTGCELASSSAQPQYCSLRNRCSESADLGGGFTMVRDTYPTANCQKSGDSWACSCAASNTAIRFPASPADPLSLCGDTLAQCDEEALVLDGTMSCSATSRSAGADYCDGWGECSQPGQLGTVAVEAYGSYNTRCRRVAEDEWSCTCRIGANGVERIVTTESAWEACGTASMACEELSLVGSGQSSGIGGGRPIGIPFPIGVPTPISVGGSKGF